MQRSRRTVAVLQPELVCLCSGILVLTGATSSDPFFICLPGVGGCLWFSVPLPGKEVALAHVMCVMIINCLQWAFFPSIKRKHPPSSSFNKTRMK